MEFENDILTCLEVLKNGGIILYPTDTIWGIGCDATNASAVGKIYAIKERPDEKSMIVLMAGKKEILRYVAQPDLLVFDYLQTVQKPTTVIYDGAIGLAENLINKDGSIAIRICQDDFCRHLLKRFGKPLVSTSANISGQPLANTFANIDPKIKVGVDYIVGYRQNDTEPSSPSTIIKWERGGPTFIRL